MNTERVILLVDDEENILRSLTRLLRRDGYHILRATSGADGLEQLDECPHVGVILSDQRMPEMTGVQFLSKVREIYPNTVRMVLSGYTDLNTVTDAINEGAIYKFLTKPWEDELLRANVEEAFRYYELGMENERLTKELQVANSALAAINESLEMRVDEKTREVMLNMHALQISQEVLENLPVGVLGMDDSGTIVLANRMAYRLLDDMGDVLVGQQADDVLPSALSERCKQNNNQPETPVSGIIIKDMLIELYCRQMGQGSKAHGSILVLIPQHTPV